MDQRVPPKARVTFTIKEWAQRCDSKHLRCSTPGCRFTHTQMLQMLGNKRLLKSWWVTYIRITRTTSGQRQPAGRRSTTVTERERLNKHVHVCMTNVWGPGYNHRPLVFSHQCHTLVKTVSSCLSSSKLYAFGRFVVQFLSQNDHQDQFIPKLDQTSSSIVNRLLMIPFISSKSLKSHNLYLIGSVGLRPILHFSCTKLSQDLSNIKTRKKI